VLGTEFATQLETLIQSANASDIRSLQSWLATRRDRDIAEATKKQRPRSVQLAEEKFDCLIYLASQEPTVPSLLYTLRKLFNDKASGLLTLSTIHKSKGLEWPRVFFLDVKLIPSRYATQPWELAQETNLRYVGVTRAKLDLIYIVSERWEGQEVEDEE
jgi:superfamily I DNA/RNA helicase